MQKVLALILAVSRARALSVLTHYRPKAALPFGGLYRLIDFTLSSLMHSEVRTVGVISQFRTDSLINHLNLGEAWEMAGGLRKLVVLPPMRTMSQSHWYRGTADAVYKNIEFIQKEDPDLVIILTADKIYSMDYRHLIDFHTRNNADATLVVRHLSRNDQSRGYLVEMDHGGSAEGGRIRKYGRRVNRVLSNWGTMNIYVFDPGTLITTLVDYVEDEQGFHFDRDILPNMISHNRVYGYKFKGYCYQVRTINEYWSNNMALLQNSIRDAMKTWGVRTNLKHQKISKRPPAKLCSQAKISNSLIHNGCEIRGRVENSIIFPGVKVADGADLRNSIVMFDSIIEDRACLDKAILDIGVNIGSEARIGVDGDNAPNERLSDSLSLGISVIGRNSYIPKKLNIGKNCIIDANLDEGDFGQKEVASGSIIE